MLFGPESSVWAIARRLSFRGQSAFEGQIATLVEAFGVFGDQAEVVDGFWIQAFDPLADRDRFFTELALATGLLCP